jgi:hypothetical protein
MRVFMPLRGATLDKVFPLSKGSALSARGCVFGFPAHIKTTP